MGEKSKIWRFLGVLVRFPNGMNKDIPHPQPGQKRSRLFELEIFVSDLK
jgi:hypothetical protein